MSWSPGVLVSWCPGVLVSWSPGVLVSWCPGDLVSWCPGLLVSWSPGVLVSCCPGLLVSWFSGVLVSWCPGGCFTNVWCALQNNLAKLYNARNHIYGENSKLKLCTCAQSMALGTRTKFQLDIPIRSTISTIHKFRENILESSRNVSETTPRSPVVLVSCCPGILVSWFTWSPGVLVSWSPGVLVSWCLGVLVSWSPVLLVSWCPGGEPTKIVANVITFEM